jgi:hypothetical protein
MIREHLETILRGYAKARSGEPFGQGHELWAVFEALRRALEACEPVARRPHLKVTWSAGKGNWAKLPWIALLDERETTTTQKGVYGVYLFRQDMSGVYATFNQGVTAPIREHGHDAARQALRERARELRALCDEAKTRGFSLADDIDLVADARLGSDFECSTIAHRLYPAGRVPEDSELLADLEAVLTSYDRYLAQCERSVEPAARDGDTPEDPEPVPSNPGFDLAAAVQRLCGRLGARGFVFEPWQVATFVTAVRTKPFVLLAGVTGTGKSRLPVLVGELTGGKRSSSRSDRTGRTAPTCSGTPTSRGCFGRVSCSKRRGQQVSTSTASGSAWWTR